MALFLSANSILATFNVADISKKNMIVLCCNRFTIKWIKVSLKLVIFQSLLIEITTLSNQLKLPKNNFCFSKTIKNKQILLKAD